MSRGSRGRLNAAPGGAWAAAVPYGRLLPVSALGGALFLIAADVLSRTLIKGQVIPVGVVTALVGAPVFALILIGRRHAR